METAMTPAFPLPPLILHPFTSTEESSLLMESSKASLALQGLAPEEATPLEELDRTLLRGRYAELKMLFYIGKDVVRWAEQCAETGALSKEYKDRHAREETFVVFLVQHAPHQVEAKLERWGVHDFRSLFRRSFALHAVFRDLPSAENISQDFLRRYHRYLDQWYEQRLKDRAFDRPKAHEFDFELFASGEYSSMLEESWSRDTANEA
jgi:hypothetical protein